MVSVNEIAGEHILGLGVEQPGLALQIPEHMHTSNQHTRTPSIRAMGSTRTLRGDIEQPVSTKRKGSIGHLLSSLVVEWLKPSEGPTLRS